MGRRSPNRGGAEVDGLLLVDKPADWTSHDVVGFVRSRYRLAKVGHGGTLDPMATGLLVLLLGRGTKCSDDVMKGEKVYEGALTLGTTTDTQDAEGQVLETKEVPAFSPEQIAAAFAPFTGEILQMPPMVSALKKDGVPLYKLARRGEEIEREARPVQIHALDILDIQLPQVFFRVRCGKGFYVRTLAHDIGQSLGCGAHLSSLRRTVSGTYRVDEALSIDALRSMELEALLPRLLPLPLV
jgi:tRNA pseudouridine55 synthase